MPEIVEMEQLAAEAPVADYDSDTEYLAGLMPDRNLLENETEVKSTYYGAMKRLLTDIRSSWPRN